MAAINLSASEAKLMAAVFSQMNELPDANYDEVANIVGIKYAKNARSSFKRLFEKVKANSASNGIGEDNDGVNKNKTAKAIPIKKATSAKKAAPAKTNGVTKKTAAPRGKASRKIKKEVKKEVKKEAEEDDSADNSGTEGNDEEEDGKFINSFTPINGRKGFGGNKVNNRKTAYQASVSGNEVDTADDEEEREAQFRGMSVEDWRAWKLENNYDAYSSHAPTPVRHLSEEAV